MNCFQQTFPYIVGGDFGDTTINSIDINPTWYDIYYGGYSSNTTTYSNVPILGLTDYGGH
jgi:hypothetical protein